MRIKPMYANEKKSARATVPNCSLDMDGIGSSIGIFFFSLKHTFANWSAEKTIPIAHTKYGNERHFSFTPPVNPTKIANMMIQNAAAIFSRLYKPILLLL